MEDHSKKWDDREDEWDKEDERIEEEERNASEKKKPSPKKDSRGNLRETSFVIGAATVTGVVIAYADSAARNAEKGIEEVASHIINNAHSKVDPAIYGAGIAIGSLLMIAAKPEIISGALRHLKNAILGNDIGR